VGAGSPLSDSVHRSHAADLDPVTLYRILALRAEVFVVEQDCAYLDPDGHDLEPGVLQLWVEDGHEVVATARLLPEGGGTRIGRVVTAAHARGRGLAARLVEHALASSPGPWVLGAQSHLAGWYGDFGFVVDGDEYLEDGIPHVPMRREA